MENCYMYKVQNIPVNYAICQFEIFPRVLCLDPSIVVVNAASWLTPFHFILFQLQSPASFSQSIQELIIALQRSGDPGNLCQMRDQFELLSQIDASPGLYDALSFAIARMVKCKI